MSASVLGRPLNRLAGTAAIGLLAIGVLTAIGGCDAAKNPNANSSGTTAAATATSPLLLDEKPDGDVKTPTDVKELEGETVQTVVAGRIDAGDLDPFQPGELSFVISQLPDADHAAGDPDHADNCPFCKRKLKNAPKAIVQFLGDDGSVLGGDARQTLGLEQGDVVYVTGMATYDATVNTVMIDATGVYRRTGS